MAPRVLAAVMGLTFAALFVAALACLAALARLGRTLRSLRGRHQVLITAGGPEMHRPLPAIQAPEPDSAALRVGAFAGREVVLLFVECDCPPCRAVITAARRMHRNLVEPPAVVVVADTLEGKRAQDSRRDGAGIIWLSDPRALIRADLGIPRVPFGILLDERGIVRMKGVVNHQDHLEALVRRRGRPAPEDAWETLGSSSGADPARGATV